MRTSTKLFLLLLIAGLAPKAAAQVTPGNCVTGTAISFLSVNDVQASLFNTGGLFFGGSTTSGDGYLVPKASGNSPIFASGVWVAGQVNGVDRVAAARYGSWDFWPGPLDENTGRPVNPNDCGTYDRLYNVTREDIANYEAGLAPARDLAEWPVDLGAPVVDGDGDPTNYNLAGGDRPEIIGDQGIWWVMNDAGGEHGASGPTGPLGIEVQVLAWAFARADALGQTTFYRYRIINKGPTNITDTRIAIFSDPDLGDAGDDYIGVDTTLSLGFVYNDSNEDSAYGSPPPAAGYDFFQGPIVGDDTLGATAFSTFINGGPDGTVDPGTAEEYYNYMRGLWGNGTPYYEFGNGFQQAENTDQITKFIYAGDPVTEEFYSEVNVDNAGTDSPQGDRRLVITTGPFTLERLVPQDIVFGLVFAQGSDYLNSVAALRAADVLAQTAYDVGFELAPPPPAPPRCNANSPNPQLRPGSGSCLEAVEQANQVTLVWGYPTSSTNYLGQFEVEDALLADQDVDDSTYNFEGFNIYRYPTSSFAVDQRELVATFDKVNGVTTVVDQVGDPDTGGLIPKVVARGSDSGLRYAFDIPGLTNNRDYFYGVTAYSFNEESTPKVIESAATQITVRPSRLSRGDLAQSAFGDGLPVTVLNQVGRGNVAATVVDPTAVTGADYRVEFYLPLGEDGEPEGVDPVYNIIRDGADGETIVFNGQDFYDDRGIVPPIGTDIFVIDGLSFSIFGAEPDFADFQVIANGSGPLDPIDTLAPCVVGFPCEVSGDITGGLPTANQQVGDARWFLHTGGDARSSYATFVARVTRGGNNWSHIAPYDFEMRFTGTSIGAKDGIFGQSGDNPTLPFELWNIGIGTPDDTSDDYRMIPIFLDNDSTGVYNLSVIHPDDDEDGHATNDHAISGGDNDPYTDWIYWYEPADLSPGTAGYDAYENGGNPDYNQIGSEAIARTVLVNWNGWLPETPLPEDTEYDASFFNQELPDPGTIFRITTAKSNVAGDAFSISSAGLEVAASGIESPEEALDRIAMVPNPYMGESDYESGNLSRVVRITNLPPEAATIQIYTVAGSLVKTLRKEGPSRSLDWDLTTQSNLPVASGMYLVRVEVAGVGERIMKFGLVNRRSRITLF